METVTVKPKNTESVKLWRVQIRALRGMVPPTEVYDKDFETFDQAADQLRKDMMFLNQIAAEDGVHRRDFWKFSIIEL